MECLTNVNYSERLNEHYVNFFKDIPGFKDLPFDDQVSLIRGKSIHSLLTEMEARVAWNVCVNLETGSYWSSCHSWTNSLITISLNAIQCGVFLNWWLVSHLSGRFWLFAPKFWKVVDTWHSMNTGSEMGIPWDDRDTQSPILFKRICLNFLHSQAMGMQNFGHKHLHHLVPGHLVEFQLISKFCFSLWPHRGN